MTSNCHRPNLQPSRGRKSDLRTAAAIAAALSGSPCAARIAHSMLARSSTLIGRVLPSSRRLWKASAPPTRLLATDSSSSPAAWAKALAKDRAALEEFLDALPPDQRKLASLRYVASELEDEFERADLNHDGKLTFSEFKEWASELVNHGNDRDEVKTPPTTEQLRSLYVQHAIPYVGFGLVDNSLMVLTGEAIDGTLGFYLGLSCLGAAALGNAFSNGLGMVLHGTIERSASALGLPDPRLTVFQRSLPVVSNVRMVAGISGVLVGCLMGMFPLLFINAATSHEHRQELQRRKTQKA